MFPLDFLVMAFAWEMGPHLKRSQTLSLTSTDRKQLEAKPSPCHYEAWGGYDASLSAEREEPGS